MKRIVYLVSIIAGIIVIALFSSNIFSQLNQHHVEMQISNDEAVTYRLKEHIVERFSKAQLDTVFVASFWGKRLRSYNADSSNEIEKVKTELNNVVPSLFKVNSIFSNMSYIDRKGAESITMDVNGFVDKPFLLGYVRDFEEMKQPVILHYTYLPDISRHLNLQFIVKKETKEKYSKGIILQS